MNHNQQILLQQMVSRMTLDNMATPFGCCNYFDSCTEPNLMSLHYRGILGLLDWLSFRPTDVCYRSVEFITYVRPEQLQGADTPGYLASPCYTPNGYEYGTRKLTVEDFGLLGRTGPVRDVRKQHIKYCESRPRYRLDGVSITSENEWDMMFTMDTLILDMNRLVITGSTLVAGQFDGLQRWVNNTHGAPLNSDVINWNGNPMGGGAGITLNGVALPNNVDIIDVLQARFRRIKARIKWNPMLAQQAKRSIAGDMVILLPSSAASCLLDFYTCWRVCPGQEFEESNLQTHEARTFRDTLIAADNPLNVYGDGYITLDGTVIPLLTHDWELINSPTQFDMYFLTGSVGSMRIWEGEILDGTSALKNIMDISDPGGYFTTDEGRVIGLKGMDMLCSQLNLWQSPRLFCYAPWMQMRFQDVQCVTPGGPLSADPADTSFFPETSFDPAECD